MGATLAAVALAAGLVPLASPTAALAASPTVASATLSSATREAVAPITIRPNLASLEAAAGDLEAAARKLRNHHPTKEKEATYRQAIRALEGVLPLVSGKSANVIYNRIAQVQRLKSAGYPHQAASILENVAKQLRNTAKAYARGERNASLF